MLVFPLKKTNKFGHNNTVEFGLFMHKDLSDLTIVVLAHENQYYLPRSIEYLEYYKINVLLLDSSVAAYQGPIPANIDYRHVPQHDYWEKIYAGVTSVSTKYTALLGVDDFFSYRGLIEACDFLENNSDYVSAAGDLISVNIGEFGSTIRYQSQCISSHGLNYDDDDTGRRLLQLQRYHYPIYYNVMRTSAVCKAWDFLLQCARQVADFTLKENMHFAELLTYIAIVIQGKHANLKTFFWLRDAYLYSASGDIEHYHYGALKKSNPMMYQAIYRIAAKVFGYEFTEMSSILNTALAHLSDNAGISKAKPSPQLFRNLKGSDLYSFRELDGIIKKHQISVASALATKFGSETKFYDKYGVNWAEKIRTELTRLLTDCHSIVLYGAGDHTRALFDIYDFGKTVVAICDGNQTLWGKAYFGAPIIGPHQILDFSETVLISSKQSQSEIAEYLKLGFDDKLTVLTLYGK
jgi:glycosyltransferase domain-containing protein